MSDTQSHEMMLDKTHPSGAEEWYCPACGRRFVMQWPPKYKRIILNHGDEYTAHGGGQGGLKMGPIRLADPDNTEPTKDDLNLDHWKAWFDSDDSEAWWPED